MKRDVCPNCGSGWHKKNGHIHSGKQNYRCLDCGRQFVAEETKELIKKALLEPNSLRGICRIFDVSLTWLLSFVVCGGAIRGFARRLGHKPAKRGRLGRRIPVYPGCRSRRNVEFRH